MTIARVVFNLCLLLSIAFGKKLWSPSKRSALKECFNDRQVCYCRDREPTDPVQQQGPGIIENYSQLLNTNNQELAHVSLYLKRLEELTSTTKCLTIPTFHRLLKDALLYAQQTPKNIELLLFLIEKYKNKKSPNFGPTDKSDSPDYVTENTQDDSDSSEEIPYVNPDSMVDNSTPKPSDPTVIVILNNIILHKNFNKKQNIDYILYVLKKNQHKLHPKIYEILVQLLKISKKGSINKLNDIMLLLINNEPEVFSDRLLEALLLVLAPSNGPMDPRLGDLILNLLRAIKLKDLDEDQLELLAFLLKPDKFGSVDPKIIDVLISILDPAGNNAFDPKTLSITLLILKHNLEGNSDLDRFNVFEILHGIKLLRPNELRILSRLLQLDKHGKNPRIIEIIFKLLTKVKNLTNRELRIIFWLLLPDYGSVQPESIELLEFLLDSMANDPKSFKELMAVFENNVSILLHSKFLNTILELYKNHLLNNKLLSHLVTLIKQEVTDNIEQPQIATLIELLEQHTQYNPQVIIHIIDTLKKYPTTPVPPDDWQPDDMPDDDQNNLVDPNDIIAPKYSDLLELLELLKKKGGAQKDLILQYLMNLSNLNNAGVVELTYILKNQRPVVINPVYYVKYRVPIPALISTLKVLFAKDPYIASNPTKLLQQLIPIGNLTEMSPGLSGYPREEIIKQTHQKGDLIQAKLLDHKTLHLNDQIALVHKLSTDNISPAELLQLNELKGLKNIENNLDISSYITSSNQDFAMQHLSDLLGEAKTYYMSKPDVGYSSIIYNNVVSKPVVGKTHIGIQEELKDTVMQDTEPTTPVGISLKT